MKWLPMRDYIGRVDNLVEPDVCAEIIERFRVDPGVREGGVVHAERGLEQNSDKLSYDLPIPSGGASGADWAPLFGHLHERVSKAVERLVDQFPGLQVYPLGSTGYKVQMYPKGKGHFAWHTDALGAETRGRLLAMILYLNDVEEGGETAFHYQRREFAPRSGSAIFFPAGWTHMHCGRVPLSDDKYIISTFFEFRDGD